MLMRLHALQIMCSGKPKISYCDDYINDVISRAIASYISYGWEEEIIYNPAKSYLEFIRYHLLADYNSRLIYDEVGNEKKINK